MSIPMPEAILALFERTNPQASSNQMFQTLKNMVANGDKAGIEQMGRNLCESLGTTPEKAFEQARRGLPF